MSELSRRRRSRELWVSRGHLWAAAAGVLMVALLSFLLGNAVGRQSAGLSVGPESLSGGEELVELLARVEASSSAGGGADRLTYPDALTGRPTEVGMPEAPALPGRVVVQAPPFAALPGVGTRPNDGYGFRVVRTADAGVARTHLESLVASDLPVWVLTTRSNGVDAYAVGVGPWETEDDGRLAAAASRGSLPVDYEWEFYGPETGVDGVVE
jgi:hypothetical protein